jgi:glutamate synthase (NADPH/NADH) large chain
VEEQDHGLADVLDWKLLEAAKPAIQEFPVDLGIKVKKEFLIKNTGPDNGTILSNEITKIHRGEGLPDDTIHFKFTEQRDKVLLPSIQKVLHSSWKVMQMIIVVKD